jgi:tetratricopeptide (TPR) repeat protein
MSDRRAAFRARSAGPLVYLSAVGYLILLSLALCAIGRRLPVIWDYNQLMIRFTKAAVAAASDLGDVHLPDEEQQAFTGQFRLLAAAMPRHLGVRYHLAWLSFWDGEFKEAIDELERLPGDVSFRSVPLLLGYAQWKVGDTDVATWRSVPDSAVYFLQRAQQAEHDRVYSDAEEKFEIAAALAPAWPEAGSGYWFAHAMRLLEGTSSTPDGAVEEAVRQAINRNQDSASRQIRLGQELYYSQEYELANIVLGRAAQLEPRSIWPPYLTGLVLYAEGEYASAHERLEQVVEMAPDFGRGHHWLARVLVQLGQEDQALAHYQEALRLLPADQALAAEVGSFKANLDSTGGSQP